MYGSAQCGPGERKITVIRRMGTPHSRRSELKEKDKHMNTYANAYKLVLWMMALVLTGFVVGCSGGGGGDGAAAPGAGGAGAGTTVVPGAAGTPGASATDPTVGSASP